MHHKLVNRQERIQRSESFISIGFVLLPLYSLFSFMPSVTRLMPVDLTLTMYPHSNKRRTVSSSALYRSVFPCSSTFQELVLPSSRQKTRTSESSSVKKPSDFLFPLLLEFSSSSFQDFTSVKLMRILLDQMMRLRPTIGSSLKRPCQPFISSYPGCGTCQPFSLIS